MAVTKAICNKGLRGISSILPRLNFGVDSQVARNPLLQIDSAVRETFYINLIIQQFKLKLESKM